MFDEESRLVKLIDFGLAKEIGLSNAKSRVGSTSYLPPEIVKADGKTTYDAFKGDTWSMGVALYVMACREYPFGFDGPGLPGAEPTGVVLQRIVSEQFSTPGTIATPQGRTISATMQAKCSPELCDLICRLLVRYVGSSRHWSPYTIWSRWFSCN